MASYILFLQKENVMNPNEYSGRHAAQLYNLVVEAGYHPQKELIDELLSIIQPLSHVLELGCGTGNTLIPLNEAGIVCEGIDASEDMLNSLRLRKPELHTAVQLADARTFVPTCRYQFIISCNGPFTVNGDEFESYITEHDVFLAMLKRWLYIGNKLLVSKSIERPRLTLELPGGMTFYHQEGRVGDFVFLNNAVMSGEKVIAEKMFRKRRYPFREVLKQIAAGDTRETPHFWLIT